MISVNEDKKKRVIKETELPPEGKNIKKALKRNPEWDSDRKKRQCCIMA